jgi:hypothetical protein
MPLFDGNVRGCKVGINLNVVFDAFSWKWVKAEIPFDTKKAISTRGDSIRLFGT